MSLAFKQTLENIKALSTNEKALIAHCLIEALDSSEDENVNEVWATIAEQRLLEIESGKLAGISWDEIKNATKRKDT